MSEATIDVSFPLDDGFLRRQCPLCLREFKVLLTREELSSATEAATDSFMIEPDGESTKPPRSEPEPDEQQLTCPYCGQTAGKRAWWTEEQVAYIHAIVQNYLAKLVDEHLIRPLKRTFGKPSTGMVSLRVEGGEARQQETWISPEANDMEVFELPCCQRTIKIEPAWRNQVHCFFCGFPHERQETTGSAP